MNYSFEEYENAVLTALITLKAPSGYLKELKGYAGEFALKDEDLYIYSQRGFPLVLVEVTEAKYGCYAPGNPPLYEQRVTLTLYVGAQSWRSQDAARGGDRGISQILFDLRRLLLGRNLGLAILPLSLEREYKIAGSQNLALYGAEYQFINNRISGN